MLSFLRWSIASLLFLFCTTLLSGQIAEHVSAIEKAHNMEAFTEHNAISFDITLRFGGSERLNARMTLATNSGAGLITYKDGGKLLFVDDKVFHSPDLAGKRGMRFSAYTWSYFFLFPYKLNDPGTIWSEFDGVSTIEGEEFSTSKLEFESGTGDAPDDWYITYADKETNLLRAGAYIVTAGASQEKAEEDPHAIEYLDYKKVDGVPISTKWVFWAWRTGKGLTDKLGDADISNLRFEKGMNKNLFSTEGLDELVK